MSFEVVKSLQAVIFDFDGVLVDSEPLHYRAFQRVLNPRGIGFSYDEYLERYIGFDDRDAFKEAYRVSGLELDSDMLTDLIRSKSDSFEKIVKKEVEVFPGAKELVREIADAGVPLAIASGALRNEIELILEKVSLMPYFTVIVSADQVEKSKPDPETYVMALRALEERLDNRQLDAAFCVAIEDTPAGIKSARDAGLKVVGVGHSYSVEELGDADYVVRNLDEISLSTLDEIAMK